MQHFSLANMCLFIVLSFDPYITFAVNLKFSIKVFCFDIESCKVAQAGLEILILVSHLPEC